MNDCEKMNEWIELYNSDNLQEPDLSMFKHLLDRDPELRVRVSIDRSVNKMLQNDDLFEFLEQVKVIREQPEEPRGSKHLMLIAASILMLISTAIITLVFETTGMLSGRLSEVIGQKPSSRPLSLSLYMLTESHYCQTISPVTRREMARNKLLAASFKPLAEYELLVGGITRSENFQLVSPKVRLNIPYKSQITFSWLTGAEWFPITLEVMNNKGVVVLSQFPVQGNSYMLDTDCLSAGLFYWKMMSDDGLIIMGSFILF